MSAAATMPSRSITYRAGIGSFQSWSDKSTPKPR
jgi:hypothetical protein